MLASLLDQYDLEREGDNAIFSDRLLSSQHHLHRSATIFSSDKRFLILQDALEEVFDFRMKFA